MYDQQVSILLFILIVHLLHCPQVNITISIVFCRLALVESVVDMLSWRLIKERSKREGLAINEWLFEIEEKYLTRYMDEDRRKVKEYLKDWKNKKLNLDQL